MLVLNKDGLLIETEVKTAISDLRHDREKPKHYHFYLDYFKDEVYVPDVRGWRYHRKWLADRTRWESTKYGYPISAFYFAVPECLQTEALNVLAELYPYAGLFIVQDIFECYGWDLYNNPISRIRPAHFFEKEKLNDSELLHMQREMSATICRLINCLSQPDHDTIAEPLEHVTGFRA